MMLMQIKISFIISTLSILAANTRVQGPQGMRDAELDVTRVNPQINST